MILQTETVEQSIDGDEKGRFIKDVIASRDGEHAIAMVRKRPIGRECRGAIVLVHGFGQNHYTWHISKRSLVNYLANDGWDVFNMDLRGKGRSRQYGAPAAIRIDEYIKHDIPACVKSAIRLSGFSRVFLMGHSMGGLIAYGAAGSALREQVAGVITIASPYRFGRGSAFLGMFGPVLYGLRMTGMFDWDPPLPMRWAGRLFRAYRLVWDNKLLPLPLRPWAPGSIEKPLLDEYLDSAFEHTRMGIALGIVRSATEDRWRSDDALLDYGVAFELFDTPLLVVAGGLDQLAPPASCKPAYERSRSRDKTYRVFPMGHADLIMGRDAPYTVWRTLRTWLDARAERCGETA